MDVLVALAVTVGSYIVGSIPFGLIIVHLAAGKDLRSVESGRTGGTNAMRAAGFWAGISTALLDLFKGAVCVWVARALAPNNAWLHIIAPLMSILGHNYSIFMTERDERGRLRLRGGAGGAPCVGGSMGLWTTSIFIIFPVGAAVLYFIGFASITTMSVAVISTIVFAIRAYLGLSPWEYAVYGVISLFLMAWSLRPNIRRLIAGNERLVGWRARK